ncbi:MAG: leucine-rich repeat domain-containing protein [Clostridia bacterium]|jgi:hypothetical protein
MKHMKKNHILLILLVVLLVLSSCDKNTETYSPDITESYEVTTPVPTKPETYTAAEYFTFDEATGTITGYNIDGGAYVNIPDIINAMTVLKIGSNAFEYLDLYGVIIPDGIIEIGEEAFYNCQLAEVEIPESIRYIGEGAFSGNKLTSVSIPSGMTEISARVFSSNLLTEIVIPDNVKAIKDNAFTENNITSITVINDVIYISDMAFDSGEDMSAICVKGSYAEYFFNRKGMHISNIYGDYYEEKIPSDRQTIIDKNITYFIEEDEFYFAENWIRKYLLSKYGSSCTITAFKTKAEDDITDGCLCLYNRVFVKNYKVSFQYPSSNGDIVEDKVISLVIIKTEDDLNILSGIEESDIDFSDKRVIYDYLSADDRFTYWYTLDNGMKFASTGDIELSELYPDESTETDDTDKFRFPDTDNQLIESDYSIYLENIISGERQTLKLRNDVSGTRYKILCVIDSARYAYTQLGRYGYEGIFIHNINDGNLITVDYPDQSYYMRTLYSDKDCIIVGHANDTSTKIEATYRVSLEGDDVGNMIKISDDIIYFDELAVSDDHKYMVYVTTDEAYEITYHHGIKHIVSDEQSYYMRNVKVIDTSTGETLKEGIIFEEGSKYNETNNGYQYTNFTFDFDPDDVLYLKYYDAYFEIDMSELP